MPWHFVLNQSTFLLAFRVLLWSLHVSFSGTGVMFSKVSISIGKWTWAILSGVKSVSFFCCSILSPKQNLKSILKDIKFVRICVVYVCLSVRTHVHF